MGFWDAITGSTVLDAGLSLYNGIANRKASKDMNEANIALQRETNDLAYKMFHEGNDFSRQQAIDMFNLENEYNRPEEQVKRLRDAGLNPALMMDNGTMVNSGDISTPSSLSTPNLVAPQVGKVPPISEGLIDALKGMTEIQNVRSKTDLQDSETWKNYQKTDAEVQQLLSDVKYKEAMTNYQNLQTSLDEKFASMERSRKLSEMAANIKKLFADAQLAAFKGETEKANKLYLEAETKLTDTKEKQMKGRFGLELMMLRANIRLLQEQRNTEKSKQGALYGQGLQSRAMAKLYNVSADIEEAKRNWMTSRGTNEYGFPTESNLEKIFTYDMRQKAKNLAKTDKEMAKLSQEVENLFLLARKNSKDLDWYEVDKCWKMAMELYKNNIELIDGITPF